MDTMETYLTVSAVILSLALISNLILVLCLIHTWKHWRQVKWYIILLCLGNWFETFFGFATRVASLKSSYADIYGGTEAWCKFLMAMMPFGPILGAMAVAAMSVHVLMTAITGCQGNRLRHALVIALFVLLSLPVPVAKLFTAQLRGFHGQSYCADDTPWLNDFAVSINSVLFPGFVFLCLLVPAVVLMLIKRTGNKAGDESLSDAVITGLLGGILLATCLPFVVYYLYHYEERRGSVELFYIFYFLTSFRNILSAIVAVIFAYVNVFRNRDTVPLIDSAAMGERQKLVN